MTGVARRAWVLPIVLSIFGAIYYATGLSRDSRVFSDFYGNVWWPGHRILEGAAAFPDPLTAWPATATILVTPLSLLPEWFALTLWLGLSVVALVGGLWLVGCRDPRAFVVALLSPPTLGCLVLGNMTLFLVAGVAVVWACRDRPFVSGTAAGLLIVVKLWLWPLAVFLVIARRWLSAATAALWCGVSAGAWWLVSPSSFESFDSKSDEVLLHFGKWGMGITSLAINVGGSVDAGKVIALSAGLCLLLAAWRASTEFGAFTLSIAAALCASPIVWMHYYAILFVPVAVVAPRASRLWFAPYLCGAGLLWPESSSDFALASALSLTGMALTICVVLRSSPAAATERSTVQASLTSGLRRALSPRTPAETHGSSAVRRPGSDGIGAHLPERRTVESQDGLR